MSRLVVYTYHSDLFSCRGFSRIIKKLKIPNGILFNSVVICKTYGEQKSLTIVYDSIY